MTAYQLTDVELRDYLDKALKIFESRTYLENERPRTTFKKGQLFKKMGRKGEADGLFKQAYELRNKVLKRQGKREDSRPMDELKEEDYDSLVSYWSR